MKKSTPGIFKKFGAPLSAIDYNVGGLMEELPVHSSYRRRLSEFLLSAVLIHISSIPFKLNLQFLAFYINFRI